MLEHAALLVATFAGAVFILVPLVFHLQNKNVSVICLCIWLAAFNGISFINGIVWNGAIDAKTPLGKGYCDIATRVQLTAQPALMGCAIAILRYLAQVLSSKGASATTRANRTRKNLIDLATIFTVPILILILQLVVDRERYSVTSFLGCSLLAVSPYPPVMIVLFIWAPLMGIISLIYAIIILLALNRKRKEFREILRNSQSGLDLNRFARLLLLSFLAIFFIAPVNFLKFYFQMNEIASNDRYTPDGDYKTIYLVTADIHEAQLWPIWYAAIISIIFAALFGFGKEAFGNYRRWVSAVPGASRLIEYTLDSTSKFSSRLSHGFSSKSSHDSGSDMSTVDAMSTYSSLDSPKKPKVSTYARTISQPSNFQKGTQYNGEKTSSLALGRGHNESALGTATCRVWKEDNTVPISPNKIKVRSEMEQRSETRQSIV